MIDLYREVLHIVIFVIFCWLFLFFLVGITVSWKIGRFQRFQMGFRNSRS